MSSRSRSSSPGGDDELRLPRVPGVVRRFWARHPRVADALIAAVCLLMTLVPAVTLRSAGVGAWTLPATPVLVVLSITACLLLVKRRQWPVAVFVASLVVQFAFMFVPVAVGSPLLLVTSYSLAVYRSSRAAWIGTTVGIATIGVSATVLSWTDLVIAAVAANAAVSAGVLGLIGTLIGVNVGNRKRYLEAVIERSRQLLVERDQQARLAASAERARIAREMHDIVSHSLTVIVALAEGATATVDPERGRAATAQVAETARGALREMRAMLGVLREDEGAASLLPTDDDAATAAVDAALSAGFPVRFRRVTTPGGARTVPRLVALATGRIVQEAITNAMRHAPGATSIDVSVVTSADAVTVEARNDGVRGTGAGAGYGLRGLQERVAHVGGQFEAGRETSGAWRLWARLPLSARDETDETTTHGSEND